MEMVRVSQSSLPSIHIYNNIVTLEYVLVQMFWLQLTHDIVQSHSMSSAHWDGECGHKEAAAMIKDMLQLSSVLDAMEDLRT